MKHESTGHLEVGGMKMPDVPLFVITRSKTFSGAEEFSYNMQTQKRATLVGQTSGGGANPGGTRRINDNLSVFIPTEIAPNEFEQKWGNQGERIAKLWRKDWDDLMQFMDYSQPLRRMIYTTNPVENLHRTIRKITKSKGAWTSKNALIKQIYMALMQNRLVRRHLNWLQWANFILYFVKIFSNSSAITKNFASFKTKFFPFRSISYRRTSLMKNLGNEKRLLGKIFSKNLN